MRNSPEKIKSTCVVVCFNEGKLLIDSIRSIQFCQEIIIIDLASEETIKNIANRFNAKYIPHPKVIVVEHVRKKIKDQAKYDWILFLDPDELLTPNLQKAIQSQFNKIGENVGVIELPWRFYFMGRPLKGTIWGGDKKKRVLVHRERVHWYDHVHRGIELKDGFTKHSIENTSDEYIHHNWVLSVPAFIEKHKRYIREEGKARYENGLRYSLFSNIKETLYSFKYCFFDQKGYKDGLLGLGLSLFWMWYVNRSLISLKRYEKGLYYKSQ